MDQQEKLPKDGLPQQPTRSDDAYSSFMFAICSLFIPIYAFVLGEMYRERNCWILVMFVMSLSIPFAIVALVYGHKARRRIAGSKGMLTGMGLATAGLVVAYIEIITGAIGGILLVLFIRALR